MHIRGVAVSEEKTYCMVAERFTSEGKPMPVDFSIVTHCTFYDDKRHAPFHEMAKIAWRVRTDVSGRAVGFVSPVELRKLKREKGLKPWEHDEDF